MKEADRLQALPDEQFGFRSGHSTTLQLLRVMEYLTTAADDNQKSLFIALDIEAAFDRVPTEDLPPKLAAMGFHPQLTFLIHNFLINRLMRVAVEGTLSPVVTVGVGVPHPPVLSPLLYILYTHDVPRPFSRHSTLTTQRTSLPAQHPRRHLKPQPTP